MTYYHITQMDLRVEITGRIDSDRLQGLFREIAANPAFHCDLPQYWNLVDPDMTDLTGHHLRDLAAQTPKGIVEPVVALISANDAAYGMARVYKTWSSEEAVKMSVFRSFEAANAWISSLFPDYALRRQ